jgi:large subunit ribosomal protein L29
MKNSELRGLSLDELKSKLEVEKENYGKLKFANSITPIENPMKIRESRKLVSRISTEIRAKELSQVAEASK